MLNTISLFFFAYYLISSWTITFEERQICQLSFIRELVQRCEFTWMTKRAPRRGEWTENGWKVVEKKKKREKTRRWYISGDALQLSPEQEQTRVRKNIGRVAMLAFLCVTSVTPRYKHGTRYMDTCITRGSGGVGSLPCLVNRIFAQWCACRDKLTGAHR